MSEPKFTPGPWKLSDDAVRRVIVGAGAKPRTVCIIENWTREPDARLLAAAPELYEALREAREWIRGEGSIVPERLVGRMTAALAKASGHD